MIISADDTSLFVRMLRLSLDEVDVQKLRTTTTELHLLVAAGKVAYDQQHLNPLVVSKLREFIAVTELVAAVTARLSYD